MISDSMDNSATTQPAPEKPKAKSKATKKPKPAKKAKPAKTTKPKAERANKKAEVIALMTRGNGATLAEIMKATAWQAHTRSRLGCRS